MCVYAFAAAMPSTFSINFMEAMQDITEMFGSTRQTDKLAFQENQDYDKLGEYEEIKITTMDDNHNRNYNMAARAISIMTICLCIVAAELLEMLIIILMILQFFGASIVCLRITFSACYVCCTLENQIFDSEKGFIPWNMVCYMMYIVYVLWYFILCWSREVYSSV